jgi:hypothetical protein
VSYAESFDLGRALTRPFAALQRCFPVLFVGGFIRMCTDPGSGGGGGGGNLGDTDKLMKNLKQHTSSLNLPEHPFAWTHDVGTGTPGLPAGWDAALSGLSLGVLVGAALVLLLLVVLVTLLRAWITPGVLRTYAEVVRTGDTSFTTLFGASDVFGRSLGWILVSGLGTLAIMAIMAAGWLPVVFVEGEAATVAAGVAAGVWTIGLLVVWVWVVLGLRFVDHAIALDELPLTEAIAWSWTITSGNRLWTLLYLIVLGVVSTMLGVAGYCLCCVGVLLTVPVSLVVRDFGLVEGYLRHTRPEETSTWAVEAW